MDVFRPDNEPLMVRNFMENVPADEVRLHLHTRLNIPLFRDHVTTTSVNSKENSLNNMAFHNPHPRRVRMLNGLLDSLICHVDDSKGFPVVQQQPQSRYKAQININTQQAPIDTLTGLPMRGVESIPYGVTLMPVLTGVELWKQELSALTQAAFGVGLPQENTPTPLDSSTEPLRVPHHPFPVCRPTTPALAEIRRASRFASTNSWNFSCKSGSNLSTPSGCDGNNNLLQRPKTAMSSIASTDLEFRSLHNLGPLGGVSDIEPTIALETSMIADYESQVFGILCQLLQSSATNVRTWLSSASDREKALALQIIREALQSNNNLVDDGNENNDSKNYRQNTPGSCHEGSRPQSVVPLPPEYLQPSNRYRPRSSFSSCSVPSRCSSRMSGPPLPMSYPAISSGQSSRISARSVRPVRVPSAAVSIDGSVLTQRPATACSFRYTNSTPTLRIHPV